MGFSGISLSSLLVILALVVLVFGTKRLGRIGREMGRAVKHFRSGLQQGQASNQQHHTTQQGVNTDDHDHDPSSKS